jgi:hypothetical protein
MSQEEERSVHRAVVASKYGSTREVAGELGQGDRPKPEDAGPEGISEAVDATSSRPSGVRKLDRDALGGVERPMVRARRTPEGDFRAGNAISAAGSRRGG